MATKKPTPKAMVKKPATKTTVKATVKPTAKKDGKKPIALPEVKITASRQDSVQMGRGSNAKKYAVKDVRNEVASNPKLYPNNTVNTRNANSIANSTRGKDNETLLMARLNKKK